MDTAGRFHRFAVTTGEKRKQESLKSLKVGLEGARVKWVPKEVWLLKRLALLKINQVPTLFREKKDALKTFQESAIFPTASRFKSVNLS